ncbi:uncharacterized protein LOC134676739 [Cydia fagiglandana]|uniref:uncharacterized protein LOC134676739 n=1 Tax=Cydia fagiglandana TaxID=1458189 RepID=UPI002FEE3890
MMRSYVARSLRDMELEYNRTDPIRQNSHHTPAYEIGYLFRTMEECFRRMVDIYNSTLTTDLYNLDAYTTDNIMFLKHVENFYWILYHLEHMLHETEKKYQLQSKYHSGAAADTRERLKVLSRTHYATPTCTCAGIFEHYPDIDSISPQPTTKRHRFRSQVVVSMTTPTKRPTKTWWPMDYGWDHTDEWR